MTHPYTLTHTGVCTHVRYIWNAYCTVLVPLCVYVVWHIVCMHTYYMKINTYFADAGDFICDIFKISERLHFITNAHK